MGKAKTKVAELASKAKETVTNGHHEEHHSPAEEPASSGAPSTDVPEEKAEMDQAGTDEALPEKAVSPPVNVEAISSTEE